jgi:hypothetical protein
MTMSACRAWSLFITSILVLLATPVLAATLLMNLRAPADCAADVAGRSCDFSFHTPIIGR